MFILPLYYKRIIQSLGFVGLFRFGFFLLPLVNSSPSSDTPLSSTSSFWSFLAIYSELLQGLSWQQGLRQARAIAGLCALNNTSVIWDRLLSSVGIVTIMAVSFCWVLRWLRAFEKYPLGRRKPHPAVGAG